ncbi:MAG: ASTRA complex subunit [Piccolia ochrophora]|nr:MAG: ASTRA complex subunit [Piccolia ochrophora]
MGLLYLHRTHTPTGLLKTSGPSVMTSRGDGIYLFVEPLCGCAESTGESKDHYKRKRVTSIESTYVQTKQGLEQGSTPAAAAATGKRRALAAGTSYSRTALPYISTTTRTTTTTSIAADTTPTITITTTTTTTSAFLTTLASSPNSQSRGPSSPQHQPPLPPAQPVYVLRGHSAHIHVVQFIRSNARLLTGDADGWVVLWDVTSKRAVAVWKAHDAAILGFAEWSTDRILTHGRDNKLFVWQLSVKDEVGLSKELPLSESKAHRQQPWMLHALDVNTLNFCSFAMCDAVETGARLDDVTTVRPVLVAVPGALDSSCVDVLQLPSERRIHTVVTDKSTNTGMIMALGMSHIADRLAVAAGYESGHVVLFQQKGGTGVSSWSQIYVSQPHSQPGMYKYTPETIAPLKQSSSLKRALV